MRLLFDDTMFPFTTTIGFLETDSRTAAQALYDFERSLPNWSGAKYEFLQEEIPGDLKSVVLSLQRPGGRDVWVPTKSNWTAIFQGTVQHADIENPLSILAQRLKVRGVRIIVSPHTLRNKGYLGRYGAIGIVVMDPSNVDSNPTTGYLRGISCMHDGNRWSFEASGKPFPFEEVEQYQAKKVRDKFTAEMLDKYAQELGIHAFDESFYMPPGSKAIAVVQRSKDSKAKSLPAIQMETEERVYFEG